MGKFRSDPAKQFQGMGTRRYRKTIGSSQGDLGGTASHRKGIGKKVSKRSIGWLAYWQWQPRLSLQE